MELLASQTVDVAVLDISLHGERSFVVAEQLARSATPFVFLSGYSNIELPENLRDRPLMQKPFNVGRLCSCVNMLVEP
jgi:DNA-binding LytR/AlgR family response regulator